MRRRFLIALLLLPWLAADHAAAAPEWSELEPTVRRALGRALNEAEIDRLLARPEARRELAAAFAHHDGVGDEVTVERVGGEVVLRVVTRVAEPDCIPDAPSAESLGEPPPCPDRLVAHQKHDPRHFTVLEELGVKPVVGYLTLVRNREEA